jgi:SOS response regulatory protein OraA/RecX
MEHRGYIDEKKQMGILLETCLKKKYGKIKIAEEFIAKGFKREDAVEYLKGALEGIDFGASCAFIISQKYNPLPKDKDELSKMMASLMRYGYSINDIKAGIRIFAEGEKNGN